MKTKAEIIASLPERFRRFDVNVPFEDIDQANIAAAYNECLYLELSNAYRKQCEMLAQVKALVEKYS